MLRYRRHRKSSLTIGFILVILTIIIWIFSLSDVLFRFNIQQNYLSGRPHIDQRRFRSSSVDSLIEEIKTNIRNIELAWLFENCFSNTLDRNVDFNIQSNNNNNRSDTFVFLDDIDAISLRDSSVQMHPYLPLIKTDPKLKQLVEGVLLRQIQCVQRDPYANAFYKESNRASEWLDIDQTEMLDGIHERKWELDSLCYVLRLMYSYWIEINRDLTFFLENENEFKRTIKIILQTFKEQTRFQGPGNYTFQREGQPPDPRGGRAKPIGLIHSFFRPNDHPQAYPYLIPSQFFVYQSLKNLFLLTKSLNWTDQFLADISLLKSYLSRILFDKKNTMITHNAGDQYGSIYAYEINGMGNQQIMDDASIPSLLSLPYLCSDEISIDDKIYQNTRKFILSKNNPWFFSGSILEGIGGPSVGKQMVCPLAIIMRGLTTNDDREICFVLQMLQQSHSRIGFMQESVFVNSSSRFTRARFSWANSLFSELIWKLYREKRYLLHERCRSR